MSPRSQVVLRDPGGITVHRTAIPSGPQVFTELIPAVRSVSVGVWVPIGSRHETPATAGATHFLEHLLFKGTQRRSALDIAANIEGLGGEINAFTTKEYTCYHVRLLDEHLDVAIDVLADMLGASLLRTSDIEAERGVVLEEIAMSEDDPLDLGRTELESELFGSHPLAGPVAGTAHSVSTMRTSAAARSLPPLLHPRQLRDHRGGQRLPPQVVSSVTRAFGSAPIAGARAQGLEAAAGPSMQAQGPGGQGLRAGEPAAGARGVAVVTSVVTRWPSCTRSWAAACRAGCSRRSGSATASRTP